MNADPSITKLSNVPDANSAAAVIIGVTDSLVVRLNNDNVQFTESCMLSMHCILLRLRR